MDIARIATCQIHPPIGIARVGNSPDEFFVGPESPGIAEVPAGGFKDKAGRIKRQGARFRVFAFDASGIALGELTADVGEVRWTVHLVNSKGAGHEFAGRFTPDTPLRNAHVADRAALVIDPGVRSIAGRNAKGASARFDSGSFLGITVPLGELRTDERGRLIVLGGFGTSGRVPGAAAIKHYANNDGWYDDTSDGPVRATVVLPDGRTIQAAPARVVVAPPKFAPGLANIVSLYEVVRDATQPTVPASKPSFTRDVQPLLDRITQYRWVNATAMRGHGPGRPGDFGAPGLLARLASAAAKDLPAREAVFSRVRNPNHPYDSAEAVAQANYEFMPPMAGDGGDPRQGKPQTWFRILPSQHRVLERWAAGDFEPDLGTASRGPLRLEEADVAEQPKMLTRAALEPCVGAPFFPGIELTYVAADAQLYAEPFRFREDLEPGSLNQHMAVPWQADFYECNTHWWPAQRPDDVVPEEEFTALVLGEPHRLGSGDADLPADELSAEALGFSVPWARGLPESSPDGDNSMVDLWHRLGFVIAESTPTGETVLIERERAPFVGRDLRREFYMLANIDSHTDFLPKAREIAQSYMDAAWAMQFQADFPDNYRYFPFTHSAFEARLREIYTELVNDAADYQPATDPTYRSRDDVLMRILQFAPFNQLDGAWLHRATPAGPLKEWQSLLFTIWMDEAGDGDVAKSHCNLYTSLLNSCGFYLPEVSSRAYAEDPRILESAYEISVMEGAIALFSKDFMPEILGMTLNLEWTVPSLTPTIKLFEYYGIDPHFYRLHVGIDNAESGHGAMAKRAVELYLDEMRSAGGDVAVQAAWKRIWTGFIAFGLTGSFGQDFDALLSNPPSLEERVIALIKSKKRYGSLAHGDKRLGPNRINDWFDDPKGFLQQLVKSALIVPSDPDASPFFALTGFRGPMFKVFTDDELALWRSWVHSLASHEKPEPQRPIAVLMAEVIDTLRECQFGVEAHTRQKLKGESPNEPGVVVEKPLSWWFDQTTEPKQLATVALMRALADPANGVVVAGSPDDSFIVTSLVDPASAMGRQFDRVMPRAGGWTAREILVRWIQNGCELPQLAVHRARKLLLGMELREDVYPRQRIHGMGAIH